MLSFYFIPILKNHSPISFSNPCKTLLIVLMGSLDDRFPFKRFVYRPHVHARIILFPAPAYTKQNKRNTSHSSSISNCLSS